jgi:hypothetical protein
MSRELKSFNDLPKIVNEPIAPVRSKNFFKGLSKSISSQFSRREIVAGGDVKWKPINKEAAMLLSKAPEISKPKYTMNSVETNIAQVGGVNALSDRERKQHKSESDAALDRSVIKKADEIPDSLVKHVETLKVAKASLDVATHLFKKDMIEFTEELPKHMKTLREWRMTMEREKDTSLKALRELRQFFLESDYEREMTRLSEFVSLCERLRDLSKDGTLERVADVMLKLA